jgi:hypothetical protein
MPDWFYRAVLDDALVLTIDLARFGLGGDAEADRRGAHLPSATRRLLRAQPLRRALAEGRKPKRPVNRWPTAQMRVEPMMKA